MTRAVNEPLTCAGERPSSAVPERSLQRPRPTGSVHGSPSRPYLRVRSPRNTYRDIRLLNKKKEGREGLEGLVKNDGGSERVHTMGHHGLDPILRGPSVNAVLTV